MTVRASGRILSETESCRPSSTPSNMARVGRENSWQNSFIRPDLMAELGRWSPVISRSRSRKRCRIGKSPAKKSSDPSLGWARGATRQRPRHSEFITAVTGPRHQLFRKKCERLRCSSAPLGRHPLCQSIPGELLSFADDGVLLQVRLVPARGHRQ